MLKLRAYKFRFYPTSDQRDVLARTFGCCRFVYNHFLERKQKAFCEEKKFLSYRDCSELLSDLKDEHPFLREVSSVALQQSLRHLEGAFQGFYKKKARFPNFKKRSHKQSASFMRNAFTYENGNIILAKMKTPLNICYSRTFEGNPSSITISKTVTEEYYISFLVEEDIKPLPKVEKSVGVDLGITHVFVTSDGKKQLPSKALEKALKKLKRRQRALSKKKKGSANRTKARKKVAALSQKVKNKRLDAIHKMTTTLVYENQVICVEDLSVKNMMKNRKLSQKIGDAGWGMFTRCLEYKCDWYQRQFVQVGRFFPSSKQCHSCKTLRRNLSLKDRVWTCSECNTLHDRDINAAKNIKEEGFRLMNQNTVGLTEVKAWGADVRPICSNLQGNLQ